MWIITGPFESDDLSFTKIKLLKTGKTYGVGRKNQPLLVKSKKVSGNHCEITVGNVSLDDVHNPETRPTLMIEHQRDKAMRLVRQGQEHVVNPNKPMDLEDGDALSIVTGLVLNLKWMPICCYSPHLRGKSISLDTCASLGISILYAPSPQVTHHIIPTYATNAPIAASLISAAQFVKQEWLTDLLSTGDALENTFVLPPISKHRPSFSPALNPSQKVFKVWEPNEERLNMFSDYRFLVFGEKTRDVESDVRELIKRGGGFLETFDVAGGVPRLHKALTRGQAKEGQQLVVVADTRAMKAVVGLDDWKKLVEEVESFGLHITHPDTLVQAVIEVETSLLSAPHRNSLETENSSLPSCVMNSVPDEPSIQPEESAPPRRRLLRRATSRQPSVEPTLQPVTESEPAVESPKSRRLLSRRGKTVEPAAEGEVSNPMDVDKAIKEPTPVIPPTPNRPRLKRRLGATSAAPEPSQPPPRSSSQLPDLPPSEDVEPPLKKFKALFDASNPVRSGSGSFDEMLESEDITTQTQTQTQGFVRRPASGSSLAVLREEEEEESLPPNQKVILRGKKRTLSSLGEDIEMQDVEGRAPPSAKRQAVENVNAVERNNAPEPGANETPSNNKEKKSGAPVGKPDTDADFLKAVASTKKGKRAEDVYDREFNNLKISKPEVEQQEPEEEWRLISDFGDDAGLRGNFMVVLEMEIPKKSDTRRTTRLDTSSEWSDKPNFKKFKKKFQGTRRPLIELVVPGGDDYGDTHWETSQTHRTTRQAVSSIKQENHFGSFSLPKSANEITIDDDEDEAPRLGRTKSTIRSNTRALSKESSRAPSRAISTAPSQTGSIARTKGTMSKAPSKATLFFDSDDDIQVDESFEGKSTDLEESQTLRSSHHFSRTASSLGKRTAAAETKIVDDDSDDGAVFKGFRGGRKRAR